MTTHRCSPAAAVAAILAIVAMSVVLARAQAPAPADKQARVAALKEAVAANQAALRTYSWLETTTLSLKGEVKKTIKKECSYGADGKVVKNEIADGAPQQSAPQRGGGRHPMLKKKVVEKKVDEFKEYLEQVAALVKEYVPPDPQKIQAAEAAGHAGMQPPANGVASLTFTDYVKPGDSLALGFDAAAKKIRTYNVNSYLQKKEDAVTLAVTFNSLQDGTTYPERVVLDAKSKQMTVAIANSGYHK